MTDENTEGRQGRGDGASSVSDEAAKLAQAFSLWAQNAKAAAPRSDDEQTSSTSTGCGCSHGDTVESVCRMCPICRTAGLLQAVQPELLDRVADVLGVVADGLHTAAQQRRADTDPTMPTEDR